MPNHVNPIYGFLFPKIMKDFIFRQDGAPPHYSNKLKAYLDKKLPDRWIGRGGPILWLLHSRDFVAMFFLYWDISN